MTDSLIHRVRLATDDGDHHPPISDWAIQQALKVFEEHHPAMIAARRLVKGHTFKMGGVLDQRRHCLPNDNANQMRDLKEALDG